MPRRALLMAAVFSAVALPAAAAEPVRAVPRLDLQRYAGTWHEIARLPQFFQRNCLRNVTATYSPQPDGAVRVENRCEKARGPSRATGVARTTGVPGQLEVRFAPRWLSFLPLVWGNYWVVALDDDYRWAMVGEPGRRYLWILAREPVLPAATFARLRARAEAMGYDLAPLIVSEAQREAG